MNKENYKEGIISAIKLLDDEVQRLRVERDQSISDASKMSISSTMLSHILSIQHLREAISEDDEV